MRLTQPHLACVAVGMAGAATTGAVAANVVMGAGDPGPPPPGAFRPQPGSERVDARAADPVAGPAWAVRVYSGLSGLSCLEVGRVDGRVFGSPRPDGTVAPMPVEESGNCGDLDADVVQFACATLSSRANAGRGERTVLFGRAADEVRVVRLEQGGRSRPVSLAPDRTFIVIRVGRDDPASFTLQADLQDGSTRSFGLG